MTLDSSFEGGGAGAAPRRTFALARLLVGAVLLAAAPVVEAAEVAPADFVLLGGKVYTLDAANTVAQAVAVRGEKIAYVGDDAGAQPFIGPTTKIYRAAGRTVVPGINETHVHALGAAAGEVVEPFVQLTSVADIQRWVREAARRTPAGDWIRLPRIDVTRIAERRMPTPAELEAAVADRPVVYVWAYANRQVQVLNRAALAAAGITRDTPQPKTGRIVVDAAGNPTGVIEDAPSLTAKFQPSRRAKPEQTLDSLVALHRIYNGLGITSITERGTNADGRQTYETLKSQGRLSVRTVLTIRIGTDGTMEGTRKTIRALPFRFGDGDDWVRVGPLKIGVDGGVLYGTAYMREAYGPGAFGLYGIDDAAHRGLLQMDAARVTTAIRAGHELGWQMSSHVTGDAGVDLVLDAVEAADRDAPIAGRRYTLIHAYFPHPETARRAARLGVCVDTQPAWFYKDGDALADALGTKRMEHFIGAATWRAAGVKVALNSDHMQGFDPDLALNPFNPWTAMYAAVARRTESGRVLGADERVSRLDALRMMTVDAAYLHFDEGRKGTLEPGRLGDLAVLTDDYFACEEQAIPKIRAVLTVVGGRVVHGE